MNITFVGNFLMLTLHIRCALHMYLEINSIKKTVVTVVTSDKNHATSSHKKITQPITYLSDRSDSKDSSDSSE